MSLSRFSASLYDLDMAQPADPVDSCALEKSGLEPQQCLDKV